MIPKLLNSKDWKNTLNPEKKNGKTETYLSAMSAMSAQTPILITQVLLELVLFAGSIPEC